MTHILQIHSTIPVKVGQRSCVYQRMRSRLHLKVTKHSRECKQKKITHTNRRQLQCNNKQENIQLLHNNNGSKQKQTPDNRNWHRYC